MANDYIARLLENGQEREKLLAERNTLIREAKAAKVPITHISAAAGLSTMHVHRILKEPENP